MTQTRKARPATDPWMSLLKAAKLLGQSRQTVLTRVAKGEVEAMHIAGRTVVSRASVEKLLEPQG